MKVYTDLYNGDCKDELKKLLKSIKERMNQLKSYPDIGKKTTYKNHRSISLGHYSIIYKREIGKIIITAFWDNRQDSPNLLDYLKNNWNGVQQHVSYAIAILPSCCTIVSCSNLKYLTLLPSFGNFDLKLNQMGKNTSISLGSHFENFIPCRRFL